MTNLHESYLAGNGFDITTPRLKKMADLPRCQLCCGEYACMYVCVHAQMCARLNMRVCRRLMDGRTKDGEMGGFKCVHVCVHDPACMHITLCARME